MPPVHYDPNKPHNEMIRYFIETTHSFSPFPVRRHGKRYCMQRGEYFEQDADDGIGTKALLHWQMNTVENGADDAFAMVADDLIEGGFEPYSFSDHLIMQEENAERIYRIIGRLTNLCRSNRIALIGGETAICNTIQGFELGVHGRGMVHETQLLSPNLQDGDVLIGLGSSGPHSNGYTFFRDTFLDQQKMNLQDTVPWGGTLGESLTQPTRIYLSALKDLLHHHREYVRGMVHITGGGLSKLRELLPSDTDAPHENFDIYVGKKHTLKPHKIFELAYEFDVPSKKMYQRFNNGIGYVVAVSPRRKNDALSLLNSYFPSDEIGEVRKGSNRVIIESQYKNEMVEF